MGAEENKRILYRCIERFNQCTLEWVDEFYSKDPAWTEQPTASFPKGRSGGFEAFRNAANGSLRIFPDRTLTVLRCVAEADCVVFEQEWRGTIAIAGGGYQVGDLVKIRIATFFTVNDGLIVGHSDYPVLIR